MPDQTLLLLLDEVRGKTLLILDATPAEFTLRAPPGLGNHILWYGGQSYVVVESLAMRALGRPPEIPEGRFEMFSWDSRPALVSPEQSTTNRPSAGCPSSRTPWRTRAATIKKSSGTAARGASM